MISEPSACSYKYSPRHAPIALSSVEVNSTGLSGVPLTNSLPGF